MNLLFSYSKRLLVQWEYIFGIFIFIFTLTAILGFVGVEVYIPTWISVLILIISLYLGSFFVYKDVVEKLPDTADLDFKIDSAEFVSRGWGPVYPSSPLELNIHLTINNKGEEKAKLSNIKYSDVNLNTDFFNPNVDDIEFTEVPPDSKKRKITFPIEIPGRDWSLIICKIPIYTAEHPNEKDLVHKIKDLTNFDLSMSYEYENMDGESFKDSFSIQGNYSAFIDQAINNWRSRGQHELVYIMYDINGSKTAS